MAPSQKKPLQVLKNAQAALPQHTLLNCSTVPNESNEIEIIKTAKSKAQKHNFSSAVKKGPKAKSKNKKAEKKKEERKEELSKEKLSGEKGTCRQCPKPNCTSNVLHVR